MVVQAIVKVRNRFLPSNLSTIGGDINAIVGDIL